MSLLPNDFAALEPFVAEWALASTAERAAKRGSATPEQRQAFYDAMLPLVGKVLADLDVKPIAELDAREKRLLDLALMFSHVSLAVEIQGKAEAEHSRWRAKMRITQAPADRAG